jgi:hypothetical protein
MATDIEYITAPGKYEIDRSFEEIEQLLKQEIKISKDNNYLNLTKQTDLSIKDNYNGLRTN